MVKDELEKESLSFTFKNQMSTEQKKPNVPQSANNCFAGAIQRLMNDKSYDDIIGTLAQISQILQKIDSQEPGATDALLTAIINSTERL